MKGSGLVRVGFSSSATIAGVGTAIASRLYRLNSIWNPDFTAGGQPMYHDQLEVLYNHYKVVGCKISCRVTALGNNSTSEYPILCGFSVRPDSTLATDVRKEIENGRCKTMLITSAEKSHQLVTKFSARSFFGTERYDDEACGAAFGASPSDLAWGHFFLASQNSSSATPTIYYDIKIEFLVKVGEPKLLARS